MYVKIIFAQNNCMIKKIVVIAEMNPNKGVIPLKIIWDNDREFLIDRVIDKRKVASTKGGGVGLRYTCRINGKEKYLYFNEDIWFVEI